MKLKELLTKDVINEQDGIKLGRVYDLDIDIASGKISSIKIKDGNRLSGLLKSGGSVEVSWNKIIKIGSDVIIVDTLPTVNNQNKE